MPLIEYKTTAFSDQKPGTSGLRKKTSVFMEKGYLENFVQAIFDAMAPCEPIESMVVGGDGRFFNKAAIQIIIKIAIANGCKKLMIARDGILSTPAASNIIRKYHLNGGIILSASHNPGGIDKDFGIKFNSSNGSPASTQITEAIFEKSKQLSRYMMSDMPDIDLGVLGGFQIEGCEVNVFDPVEDYVSLMKGIFDFDRIANLLQNKRFSMCFDAMNAVTGPYAKAIFEQRLGAPAGSVMRATPMEDFGGAHPDPNLSHAKELVAAMFSENGHDFGAASDGDGDRNMILGKGIFVSPGDSLAILAANYHLIPAYKGGISGVARSMPTSQAVDKVAKHLGVACYETPTGWKYFGNLLDASFVTLCGEESFGTGSNHVREKDGLWAALFWLNILACTKKSVAQIVMDHWKQFGRDFYSRHDYEGIDVQIANEFMDGLRRDLSAMKGKGVGRYQVAWADDFSYLDPIDKSFTEKQGIRLGFEGEARAVFRLSGTGTKGATLRIYFEQPEKDHHLFEDDTQKRLTGLIEATCQLTKLEERIGRAKPDVVT